MCEQKKPCDQICIPDDTLLQYHCSCSDGYKLTNSTHCQGKRFVHIMHENIIINIFTVVYIT